MFDRYRFPYSDFNKVNLDWIMKHLPIECELTAVDSDVVTLVNYNAVLLGEYLFADVHLYAPNPVSVNTALFTLPYNAETSYQTSVYNSNAHLFVDSNTKTAYIDGAFSGHIYAKCLIKIDRGY